jgi:hypothetical protein
MAALQGVSTWDVHVGYLPPARWEELESSDERARRFAGGHEKRPPITCETVRWESLGLTPRWVGDDTSAAVAAIEPSLFANRGADEWRRFRAGTAKRGELGLAISMVGAPEEPELVRVGGPAASVYLPGSAAGFASVGGPRIALATPPTPVERLGPADRDLALRLADARDPTLPWWSLSLHGSEVHMGGGGASQVLSPIGVLWPLLVSDAGEVVAAVWTSPDEDLRHYIVPWLPAWTPMLEWLARRAIPEHVPSAARRIHDKIGDEHELQTSAEVSLRADLAQLDHEYEARRADLVQRLNHARAEADGVRLDLLFGTGRALEMAVSRVLRDAGLDVTSLDQALGRSASADLLVTHAGRHWLVEVKSAAGNAGERLVATAKKHLETWPEVRPDVHVEGIVLILNHQSATHPLDRSPEAYSRPEFVRSLTVQVVTTLQLHDAWRRADHDAIRRLMLGEATVDEAHPSTPSSRPIQRSNKSAWWRRSSR